MCRVECEVNPSEKTKQFRRCERCPYLDLCKGNKSSPGKEFLKGVRSYRELMELWEKIGESEGND